MLLQHPPRERKYERPRLLDGTARPPTWTGVLCPADDDAEFARRVEVDSPVAHARRGDETEVGELLEERAVERCALAHGMDDGERTESRCEVGRRDGVSEAGGREGCEGGPVGIVERGALVVVEDRKRVCLGRGHVCTEPGATSDEQ